MEKHIAWAAPEEKELEKKVLAEYSREEVRRHLEFFSSLTRRPGTDDELQAARYIKSKLDEYGVANAVYEFDAYVGQVGDATLEVLSPVKLSFPCEPRSFTAPTPPEGITGELLWLGKGREEDYQGVDVRGKIALIQPGGLARDRMPASQRAEAKGAVAQIHAGTGKTRDIHMGQIRFTWGNPTPETVALVPQTTLLSVCNEDGQQLIELAKKGPVTVKLWTGARREYVRVRQPIGTLKGGKEPEKYVLFGGHYCSWYKGATDNAASNAMMLEMARLLAKHRDSLRRGVKFAWWAGHEQATYAGSTWLVDNFWEDLRDNAVAYYTIDGLGRGDAPGFVPRSVETRNSEVVRKFNELVIEDAFGLPVTSKQLNRSGDQSFWGVGVPSVFGKPSFKVDPAAGGGGEEIWYSHTPQDTLDKVDTEHLFRVSFKLSALSILRLCNNPTLPFEFVTAAEAITKRLRDLQAASKAALDLTSLMTQAEAFKKRAEALNGVIEKHLTASESKLAAQGQAINACLMELSRLLIPVLSAESGKYGQDAIGSDFKTLPRLQPLEKLSALEGEEYQAWRTSLLRERNRLSDVLHEANRILARTLEIL